VVAADRFGGSYPWPASAALAAAGGFSQHFAHLRAYWDQQLAGIAQIVSLPDASLVNAYRAGFIDTQIIRSGNELRTGVNGYDAEFSHDVIGILANLFNEGYTRGAHALLDRARQVIGTQTQYADGLWTYPWPWAIYLLKTGDLSFVKANFATEGPAGKSQPSIEDTAHQIAADRTGPGGIMEKTNDIDANGYWTIDNYEALTGLAAYRWLAQQVGNTFGGYRRSTTAPPTTRATGNGGWPARPTGTRASSATRQPVTAPGWPRGLRGHPGAAVR